MQQGIMFLDDEFKPLESSNWYTCDVDTFDALIMNISYLYFDNKEIVSKFMERYKSLYKYNDYRLSDCISKEGVYMYDAVTGHWVHVWDRISEYRAIIHNVSQAYISKTGLPMEGAEE